MLQTLKQCAEPVGREFIQIFRHTKQLFYADARNGVSWHLRSAADPGISGYRYHLDSKGGSVCLDLQETPCLHESQNGRPGPQVGGGTYQGVAYSGRPITTSSPLISYVSLHKLEDANAMYL